MYLNYATERVMTEYSLKNIYVAYIKTCLKLIVIKYILLKEEHRDKATFIIFIFLEMMLIVKQIKEFFKIYFFISYF